MPFGFDLSSIFTDPNTGQNIWTHPGAAGTSGLLGVNPYQELGNIGTGLLAASGPSLEPTSPGSRLGKAFAYAGERRDQGLLNDMRRQQIVDSQREALGQQQLADYIKSGGKVDLPTLLRFMPSETAKGIAAAYADPTVGPRMEAAVAALPGTQAESELKQAELASGKADTSNIYESSARAYDAAAYLKSIPGGESIATVSDETLKTLRKAKANNWDQSILGDLFEQYLTKIPRDQWGRALDAAEQMQKARNAIAVTSTSSNRAGAYGLAARQTALGEGAGLNLQSDLFGQAVAKTREASTGFKDYKLPEVDTKSFSWRQGEPPVADTGLKPPVVGQTTVPSVGSQNGRIVPQPPSVYTPLPTPAPAAAAPPTTSPTATPGDIPILGPAMRSLQGMFTDAPPNPLPPPTVPQPSRFAPPDAAPAVQGPTPRPVQTTPIDPATGSPIPTFPRKADGARAVKQGKFIAPNAQGVPTIYEVY